MDVIMQNLTPRFLCDDFVTPRFCTISCGARALVDRELPALENGRGAQGGCQSYPQGQRGGYHDNDPPPMSKFVSERVFQTQHQEKTFEGCLG